MATDGHFSPANPWPEPEHDSEDPGRVWRSWVLGVDGIVDAAIANSMVASRDVHVVASAPGQVVVRIRSDNPVSCDLHAVMDFTRGIFAILDAKWPIRTIQQIPKEKWLFLKST